MTKNRIANIATVVALVAMALGLLALVGYAVVSLVAAGEFIGLGIMIVGIAIFTVAPAAMGAMFAERHRY